MHPKTNLEPVLLRADDEDELNMRQVSEALWRGKLWILLVTLLAILLGGIYAFRLAVPEYTARSVVSIKEPEEGGSPAAATETIRSRALLEQLVTELDLTADPEFNEELRAPSLFRRLVGLIAGDGTPPVESEVLDATIDEVTNAISTTNTRQSFVFQIDVTTENPVKSARMANVLARLFIIDQTTPTDGPQPTFEDVRRSTAWLIEQVGVLTEDARSAEQAVENLNAAVAGLDTGALDRLHEQADFLRIQLEENRAAKVVADARLTEIKTVRASGSLAEQIAFLDALGSGTGTSSQQSALAQRYQNLLERRTSARDALEATEVRLATLEAAQISEDRAQIAASAGDPALDVLLAQISGDDATARQAQSAFDARFERILETVAAQRQDALLLVAETEDTLTSFMRTIDTRFVELASEATAVTVRLATEISNIEGILRDFDERIDLQLQEQLQNLLENLPKVAEGNRVMYTSLLDRLTKISEQRADSRILSLAVPPRRASAPKKSVVLILSLLFGVIGGAALVLGREFAKDTFRDASGLERASGLEVFGQLPRPPRAAQRDLATYLSGSPAAVYPEAVRGLRSRLLAAADDQPLKTLMLTSSNPGEGVVNLSAALARSFADLGERVLLLDGDFRRLPMKQFCSTAPGQTLDNLISSETALEEVVQTNPALGADVLCLAPPPQANATDIVASKEFRVLLEKTRGSYDRVLVNTPPVALFPDAGIVAGQTDTTLLAVACKATTRTHALESARVLERLSSRRPVRLVLTGVDPSELKSRMAGYSRAHLS